MALCRSGALGHAIYDAPTAASVKAFRWLRLRHCPCARPFPQVARAPAAMAFAGAHYHVVFTLPHELHPLLLHNQQTLYKLLFDAAAQSLLDLPAPGLRHPRYHGRPAHLGTKTKLSSSPPLHPHRRCPQRGCNPMAPSKTTTLPFPGGCRRRPLPRQVYGRPARTGARVALARVSALQSIAPLYKKNWRVYLKRPFAAPNKSWLTWPTTPIASPSPTHASGRLMKPQAKSPSPIATMPMAPKSNCSNSPAQSSSDASACICSRHALPRSDTTGS